MRRLSTSSWSTRRITARRRREEDRYRPGRLLELLDRITDSAAAKAVWLLTATPSQVDPIELRDLLRHVGLSGRLAEESVFLDYYVQLRKAEDAGQCDWRWVDDALRQTLDRPKGVGRDGRA